MSVTVGNPPPVVVLTAPTNSASFIAPATISCSADVTTNGHAITKVQFYSDTNLLGEAVTVPYSFDWSCSASGTYSLTARLIYDSGSTLDSASVSVVVEPPAPANVHFITVGDGTLSPSMSTKSLTVGKTYTVTAVPAANQEFAGWSGSITSSTPTLSFKFTTNLVLRANFVQSPFAPVLGNYNGLFYEADQVRQHSAGFFTVSLAKHGTYSGRLQIGSDRYSFHGQFDLQCQATNIILRAHTNSLNLQLSLGTGDQADQMLGMLTDGTWLANLSGDRALFNSRTNPAPCAGTYTLLLPGQDENTSLPMGYSFGQVRVDAGGGVRLAATLADGTTVSQSAPLSKHSLWPLYIPLYSSQGSLLSWQAFTNRPGDDFNGALSWIKPANPRARYYPAGFTNECQAIGSVYLPPVGVTNRVLNLSSAILTLAGGNLSTDLTNLVALGSNSRVTNLSTNQLSMSFSLSTGCFRGNGFDPLRRKSVSFGGAVFQKLNAGYGFHLGTNVSGTVLLSP